MRILVSAILLALSGNKKETKCTTGEEMTNSYIPAGLQVLNHYLTQIRPEEGRGIGETLLHPLVPTIVVDYISNRTKATVKSLEKLESALDDEASDQGLAHCKGLTWEVMRQLERSSKLTAAGQLAFILKRIVNGELRRPTTKKLIAPILKDLGNWESDLCLDLMYVTPLKYLSDLSLE